MRSMLQKFFKIPDHSQVTWPVSKFLYLSVSCLQAVVIETKEPDSCLIEWPHLSGAFCTAVLVLETKSVTKPQRGVNVHSARYSM